MHILYTSCISYLKKKLLHSESINIIYRLHMSHTGMGNLTTLKEKRHRLIASNKITTLCYLLLITTYYYYLLLLITILGISNK